MKRRLTVLFVPVLLAAATFVLGAKERLIMSVSPAYAFEPATLRIRVRVDPNADNRTLDVVAESDEFYRSSQIQLDGERAPRVVTVDFRGVPGGEYEVRSVLTDHMGRAYCSMPSSVTVLGAGAER